MKPFFTYTTSRVGLGSALETVIHTAVNAAPLPSRLKRRIKNCPNCKRTARRLDHSVPNINPLAP